MPTVMRIGSHRVMVKTNDHAPAHVHVVGDGAEARIQVNVSPVVVLSSKGYSKSTLRKIVATVDANREVLMNNWKEFHDEE